MQPPENLLPYLFWAAIIMTILVAIDLVFFCTTRRRFAVGFIVAMASILALVMFDVSNSYTGVGINEATWYHLQHGRDGLTWGLLMPIVQAGFLGIVSGLLLGWYSWKRMQARRKAGAGARRSWAWVAPYALALGLSPGLVQAAGLALTILNQENYQAELLSHMATVDTLESVENPKSVVYIYAESLEATFLDPKLFPGLTPNLSKMRTQALSLEGQRQAPFTSWTIAGIIASQCAFPALGHQNHREESSSGDMVCLGDLLHGQGYTLNYFNGADLSFTGKALFFQSHHFDLAEGKQELQKRLPDAQLSTWGVQDEDLFKVVGERFDALLAQEKPFFLGTLTVDTHPPHGYPSQVCKDHLYQDGSNKMLNAVHCSDYLIGKLVEKIRNSGREDVIVVVASDHLQGASASSAGDLLDRSTDRRNLWMAMGASISPQAIHKEGTSFDIAPTLLSLMGYDVPAFHLGRDLAREQESLMGQMGQDRFYTRVSSAFSRGDDGRWKQAVNTPTGKIAQK